MKYLTLLIFCIAINIAGRAIAETYSCGFVMGSIYGSLILVVLKRTSWQN